MAMNGTNMGDEIVAAMKVANPAITGALETTLKAVFEVVATAIVAHIAANASVSVAAADSAVIKNGTVRVLTSPAIS